MSTHVKFHELEPVEKEVTDKESVDQEAIDEEPVNKKVIDEELVEEKVIDEDLEVIVEPVGKEVIDDEPVEKENANEEPLDKEIAEKNITDEEPVDKEVIDEEPVDKEVTNDEYLELGETNDESVEKQVANKELVDKETAKNEEPDEKTIDIEIIDEEPVEKEVTNEVDKEVNNEPVEQYITNEDPITSEEPVKKEITDEEPIEKEVTNAESVGKEVTNNELMKKESNEEPVEKEVTYAEPVQKEVFDEQSVTNKEVLEKEVLVWKDVTNEEPVDKGAIEEEPDEKGIKHEEPVEKEITNEKPLLLETVTPDSVAFEVNNTNEELVEKEDTTEQKDDCVELSDIKSNVIKLVAEETTNKKHSTKLIEITSIDHEDLSIESIAENSQVKSEENCGDVINDSREIISFKDNDVKDSITPGKEKTLKADIIEENRIDSNEKNTLVEEESECSTSNSTEEERNKKYGEKDDTNGEEVVVLSNANDDETMFSSLEQGPELDSFTSNKIQIKTNETKLNKNEDNTKPKKTQGDLLNTKEDPEKIEFTTEQDSEIGTPTASETCSGKINSLEGTTKDKENIEEPTDNQENIEDIEAFIHSFTHLKGSEDLSKNETLGANRSRIESTDISLQMKDEDSQSDITAILEDDKEKSENSVVKEPREESVKTDSKIIENICTNNEKQSASLKNKETEQDIIEKEPTNKQSEKSAKLSNDKNESGENEKFNDQQEIIQSKEENTHTIQKKNSVTVIPESAINNKTDKSNKEESIDTKKPDEQASEINRSPKKKPIQQFQCKKCFEMFGNLENLSKHDNHVHKTSKATFCKICNRNFRNENALKMHHTHLHKHVVNNQKATEKKNLICEKCKSKPKFKSKKELTSHMSVFHKEIPCDLCSEIFSSNYKLQKHKDDAHANELPSDRSEQKKADSNERETKKIDSEKQNSGKTDGENDVDGSIRKSRRLKGNVKDSHKQPVSEPIVTNHPFKCDTCETGFKSKYFLNKHECPIDSARTITCKLCQANIVEKNYEAHEILCANNNKVTCSYCQLSFNTKTMLLRHFVLEHHLGTDEQKATKRKNQEINSDQVKKPKTEQDQNDLETSDGTNVEAKSKSNDTTTKRKCVEIDFLDSDVKKPKTSSKNEKNNLKTSKEFRCDKCNEVLNNQINLEKHIAQVHGKVEVIKCEECSKTFRSAVLLDKHIINAHKNVIKCNACSKVFKTLYLYSKHNLSVHNNPGGPDKHKQKVELPNEPTVKCPDEQDTSNSCPTDEPSTSEKMNTPERCSQSPIIVNEKPSNSQTEDNSTIASKESELKPTTGIEMKESSIAPPSNDKIPHDTMISEHKLAGDVEKERSNEQKEVPNVPTSNCTASPLILVEKLSLDGTGQKMPGIYENAEVPDVPPSNETAPPDNIDEKYKLENVRQNLSEDDENSSLSAPLSIENTSIGTLDSEGSKLPESENEAIVEASAPEIEKPSPTSNTSIGTLNSKGSKLPESVCQMANFEKLAS
uniref:Zinc finger protein 26 n=1 Tax=Cacopsylla melanoneura TaxID=428564 RepID=A0A8D8W816_9HEMI